MAAVTRTVVVTLFACGSEANSPGADQSNDITTSFCNAVRFTSSSRDDTGELLCVTRENVTIEDRTRRGGLATVRNASRDGAAASAAADSDGRASTGLGGSARSSVWSPDGMSIAFIAVTGEGAGRQQDLFVMAHDGSNSGAAADEQQWTAHRCFPDEVPADRATHFDLVARQHIPNEIREHLAIRNNIDGDCNPTGLGW